MAIQSSNIARMQPARRRALRMVQDLVPSKPEPSKLAASAAAAALGAPLASRVVAADTADLGPEALAIQGGEAVAPTRTETQEAIADRGTTPRYDAGSIMGLVSSMAGGAEANPNYDPNAPIGGANVPYQGTSGVGGFFKRLIGNTANEQNLAAQQAQGAEWREAAKEQEKENRLLKRIEAGNAPAIAGLAQAAKFREGDVATRKTERAEDRADRLKREAAEEKRRQEEREDKLNQWVQENALRDAQFGLSRVDAARRFDLAERELGQTRFGGLGQNSMFSFDPTTKQFQILTGGTPSMGTMFPGTEPTLRNVASPFVSKGGAGSSEQVDRTTGQPLPAGGGVLKPSGSTAPAPAAAVTTPPRSMASPMAGEELTAQFKSAMPSLDVERKAGPGVASPFLSEGELAQQAMSQIAYPLRAAVAQQVKDQYANPEAAAMTMESPRPFMRFKRPSAEEQQQALSVADLIRKMYAE